MTALYTTHYSAAPLGVRITSVSIQEPNLEAVFLRLTGQVLRDA